MRSYGQFCALARALDLVGDRWTLLVVRELLVADASYGELQHGLPGIATNLLADRLRQLEAHGLVWREATGKATRYGLTPRGKGLAEVVHALIRWGAPEMSRGPDGDISRAEWLVVALSALVERAQDGGRLGFLVDGRRIVVDLDQRTAALAPTFGARDVTIETDPEGVLALASGSRTLASLMREGRARCAQPRTAAQLLDALSSHQ